MAVGHLSFIDVRQAALLEEDVLTSLRRVQEPDLQRDIVSLGYVKNLSVSTLFLCVRGCHSQSGTYTNSDISSHNPDQQQFYSILPHTDLILYFAYRFQNLVKLSFLLSFQPVHLRGRSNLGSNFSSLSELFLSPYVNLF